VADGLQGDNYAFLRAGVAVRKPGDGWSFQTGPECVLTGPGGVTVVVEASPGSLDGSTLRGKEDWEERLEDLRSQGFEVKEEAWNAPGQGGPPGRFLAAARKIPRGRTDQVAEAWGRASTAELRLYVRGTWGGESLSAREARALLGRVFDESLFWFPPMQPLSPGGESADIDALLGRWTSAFSRADLRVYLSCFHTEAPGLALEREFIETRSGTFTGGATRWEYRRESLIVDGPKAVAVLTLTRLSRIRKPLQAVRLKVRLLREAASWRIHAIEAL
jgi:hypothetical protein